MPEKKKIIWFASSDTSTRKIVYDVLRKQNHSVKLFESGIRMAEGFKKGRPEYLILDFLLEVIDGAKLCEHLKGDTRYKNIPVILLLSEDTPESFESQADILLRKRDKENLALKVVAAISSLINDEEFPVQLWEKADKKQGHVESAPLELFGLKNKFDAVYEKNVAGILELDNEKRIVSMNAMMESILGIPVLDIIGDNILKKFPKWQSELKLIQRKILRS
jgi:CheY-like chemotaxis protein